MKRTHITGLLVGVLAVCGSLVACSDSGGDTKLTVLAAASLRDVFPKIADDFEKDHEGVTVEFSFAGSSGLAAQVVSGAPADVLATASEATMDTAADAVTDPTVFTSNLLEIAVSPDSEVSISQLSDLAKPGVTLALCQEDVPCGASAKTLFTQAGLTVTPATYSADVSAVLTLVANDDADAGIVYRTDVKSAGDQIVGVEIPADQNVSTTYPIGVVKASEHQDLAQAFVDQVTSDAGQQLLTEAGFSAP